jgi:hypothetical protein
MTVIHVPRPPKSALNLNRPVNSLLKVQIEHLHAAEQRLPLRFRSEIYANAIKTEGEAGEYIRTVTEAIQDAHAEAATRRARRAPKRGLEIAASADERPPAKGKGKKSTGKPGRKK